MARQADRESYTCLDPRRNASARPQAWSYAEFPLDGGGPHAPAPVVIAPPAAAPVVVVSAAAAPSAASAAGPVGRSYADDLAARRAETTAPPASRPSAPRPAAARRTADDPARLTQAMDAVVQLDSRSWVFNRYDIGSMSNVRVRDGDAGSEAQGDYTYNGGTPGWVRVRFSGEDIQCIEYHDFAGTCRAIGDNPARRAAIMGMISVAGAAMTSSPGSSHGSDGDHALEHQINQRRQCLAAGGGTAC